MVANGYSKRKKRCEAQAQTQKEKRNKRRSNCVERTNEREYFEHAVRLACWLIGKGGKNENARVIVLLHSAYVRLCVWCCVEKKEDVKEEKQ
jgi:hypothetical protein